MANGSCACVVVYAETRHIATTGVTATFKLELIGELVDPADRCFGDKSRHVVSVATSKVMRINSIEILR